MKKILFFSALTIAIAGLIGMWTDRNLEFWLSYFKGHQVEIPYWMSLLLSLVLNAVIVGANIISEIIRLAFM